MITCHNLVSARATQRLRRAYEISHVQVEEMLREVGQDMNRAATFCKPPTILVCKHFNRLIFSIKTKCLSNSYIDIIIIIYISDFLYAFFSLWRICESSYIYYTYTCFSLGGTWDFGRLPPSFLTSGMTNVFLTTQSICIVNGTETRNINLMIIDAQFKHARWYLYYSSKPSWVSWRPSPNPVFQRGKGNKWKKLIMGNILCCGCP